jgi:hypothetical protein
MFPVLSAFIRVHLWFQLHRSGLGPTLQNTTGPQFVLTWMSGYLFNLPDWTMGGSNGSPQVSTDLSRNNWVNVTNPVTCSNGVYQVTVPITNQAAFFRLAQQARKRKGARPGVSPEWRSTPRKKD